MDEPARELMRAIQEMVARRTDAAFCESCPHCGARRVDITKHGDRVRWWVCTNPACNRRSASTYNEG